MRIESKRDRLPTNNEVVAKLKPIKSLPVAEVVEPTEPAAEVETPTNNEE